MKPLVFWRLIRHRLGIPSRIVDYRNRPFPLERAQRCVGKGWAGLVEEAYGVLLDGACVTQVKEKFGGLRFYYHDVVDHPEIDEIEERSESVCETCGAPGRGIVRPGGWLVTACLTCAPHSEEIGQ